jgi:hypothetical protein
MQHKISKLVSLMLLLFIMDAVHAQQDSIKSVTLNGYKTLSDTSGPGKGITVVTTDSMMILEKYTRGDSVFYKIKHSAQYKAYDSLSKFNSKLYHSRDSLLARQSKKMLNRNLQLSDSLRQLKYKAYTLKSTSTSRQLKRMNDSVYAFKKFSRLDSLNYRKRDSLYRKMAVYKKMDSLKVRQLKYRIMSDSLKMKQLKLYYIQDSLKQRLRQREVTMELPYKNGDPIYITNLYPAVVISTNKGNTVKISSRVPAGNEWSDRQWFDAMEVTFRHTDSGIRISSVPRVVQPAKVAQRYNTVKDLQQQASAGQEESIVDPKRIFYISVPAEAPLNIVSRYADVALQNNTGNITIDMNNGRFKMKDAYQAKIKSRYASLETGNITNASIEIDNCTLQAASINALVIDSKNSKVNFGRMATMQIKSLNDQYEMQQVNYLEGNKSFGRLNILHLNNDLDLNATSADIRIVKINNNAGSVKINNRYATVSLPLNNMPNYTASVGGSNSQVLRGSGAINGGQVAVNKEQQFTVSAGSLSGTHTRFLLNCNSCTIDLR